MLATMLAAMLATMNAAMLTSMLVAILATTVAVISAEMLVTMLACKACSVIDHNRTMLESLRERLWSQKFQEWQFAMRNLEKETFLSSLFI